MLVLSREPDERIVLTHPDGSTMVVEVVEVRGNKVRLGITAPRIITVDREEVHKQKHPEYTKP